MNEFSTVVDIIKVVPQQIKCVSTITVFVFDTGSTDEIATQSRIERALIIPHGINREVSTAFQTAISYAVTEKFDLMVKFDGDSQFRP